MFFCFRFPLPPAHLPRGVSACRRRSKSSEKTRSWKFEHAKVSKSVKNTKQINIYQKDVNTHQSGEIIILQFSTSSWITLFRIYIVGLMTISSGIFQPHRRINSATSSDMRIDTYTHIFIYACTHIYIHIYIYILT